METERSVISAAPAARGREVDRARAAAHVLDSALRIPGTNIRVGLDPLVGLVPGVGDLVGGVLSAYVVVLAVRHGAPRSVLLRMLSNVAIDSLVGAVPVVGDLFDVGWKASTRNVALLEQYLERPVAARRSSRAFVAAVLGATAVLVAGAVYLGVAAVRLLAGLLD